MTEARADRKGIWLPDITESDSCAAVFDGRVIWRFDPPKGADGFVAWPAVIRPWLVGRSHLVIDAGEQRIDLGEVRFGDSDERIEFVDKHGIPILVDKWGLTQRPFDARGSEVLDFLAEEVERMVRVVREGCGIDLWMAFGTLLGAMRSGRAIAHDSDVDLAFLSTADTPAEMQAELMALHRVLVRAGYLVIPKSGSFLTLSIKAPDGAPVSIDVYICFHVEDMFYATATLRTELPVDAVLPLGEQSFHGRMLPAPADPDRVLAASYGPRWREPDPGFKHSPSHRVIRRFDEWFGNYMRQRRDWEHYWRSNRIPRYDGTEPFLDWVRADLDPGNTVLDVGAGRGRDALRLAEGGHEVWALDYARDAAGPLRREARRMARSVRVELLNLYDLRDTLSMGAVITRDAGRDRVMYLRHTLDAMPHAPRENLWRLAEMVLRRSGRLYAEFDEVAHAPKGEFHRFYRDAGRQWEVTRDELREEWRRFGAREIHRSPVPTDPGRTRWRMVLSWS